LPGNFHHPANGNNVTFDGTSEWIDMKRHLILLFLLPSLPILCDGQQPVRDADGNSYPVVTIGTQVWMTENLKTTRFRDTTGILQVDDTTAWGFQSMPAYCWYGNVPTNKDAFGALYNGFAAGSGRLCPDGWHVPDTAEWNTLVRFLGGKEVAGGKLKTKGSLETGTSYWFTPNTGASNTSGFSALPAGARELDGNFHYLFSHGYFWTSTPAGTGFIYYRLLSYDYPDVLSGSLNIQDGLSVRCIRNSASGFSEPGGNDPIRFIMLEGGSQVVIRATSAGRRSAVVIDLTGRTVRMKEWQGESVMISLDGLDRGIYLVTVTGAGLPATFRFLKP